MLKRSHLIVFISLWVAACGTSLPHTPDAGPDAGIDEGPDAGDNRCQYDSLLLSTDRNLISEDAGDTSACYNAGGHCVLGGAHCLGTTGPEDCNPTLNPGGAFCCHGTFCY